jgi:hypothetical protein
MALKECPSCHRIPDNGFPFCGVACMVTSNEYKKRFKARCDLFDKNKKVTFDCCIFDD